MYHCKKTNEDMMNYLANKKKKKSLQVYVLPEEHLVLHVSLDVESWMCHQPTIIQI